MGINPKFTAKDIRDYAYSKRDAYIEAAVEAYKEACVAAVRKAKQTDTYKDQTHYLRSSIGCVLYHKGAEVFNYFESEGGTNGNKGASDGLAYARRIAEQKGQKPIVAVIVAGAEYAVYVEAKGFDVLTGSETYFKRYLKEAMDDVDTALKNHITSHFGL